MPAWDEDFNPVLRNREPRIIELVARTHALASVIRGIPIPPLVQQRLDRLNILRAVSGTTGIEGTELSDDEVGLIMESPPGQPVLGAGRGREEQEVRNADALMRFVAQRVERYPNEPLSEELIAVFHEILTRDINYPHNDPGRYRNHPVTAGSYRPPATGDEVRRLMKEFIFWSNTGLPTTWDPVIRAITAHFYVVTIHPFGDGNGRTSRAVESYLLYQAGVNARGYYSLANFYYKNRAEYVENLNQARWRNDLTPFVTFALEGLVQELEMVHEEVLAEVRLISFRDYARQTLSARGNLGTPAGRRQLELAIVLSEGPVSIRAIRSGGHELFALYKGLNIRTMYRDFNLLKQHGLILVDGDGLQANLDYMTKFTA